MKHLKLLPSLGCDFRTCNQTENKSNNSKSILYFTHVSHDCNKRIINTKLNIKEKAATYSFVVSKLDIFKIILWLYHYNHQIFYNFEHYEHFEHYGLALAFRQ